MYVPNPVHLYQIWNLGYANAGPVAYVRTYLPRRSGAHWWFGITEPCNAVNGLYFRAHTSPVLFTATNASLLRNRLLPLLKGFGVMGMGHTQTYLNMVHSLNSVVQDYDQYIWYNNFLLAKDRCAYCVAWPMRQLRSAMT